MFTKIRGMSVMNRRFYQEKKGVVFAIKTFLKITKSAFKEDYLIAMGN